MITIFECSEFKIISILFAECPLVLFATPEVEKIPFVFLPLGVGQAIYPSADIQLNEEEETGLDGRDDQICLVTATDVLYRDGWHNLEKIYKEFNGGDKEHFYHHPIRLVQSQSEKTRLLVRPPSLKYKG